MLKACLASESLSRILISSTTTQVIPSRSIDSLGYGITFTPSQSLMLATLGLSSFGSSFTSTRSFSPAIAWFAISFSLPW